MLRKTKIKEIVLLNNFKLRGVVIIPSKSAMNTVVQRSISLEDSFYYPLPSYLSSHTDNSCSNRLVDALRLNKSLSVRYINIFKMK